MREVAAAVLELLARSTRTGCVAADLGDGVPLLLDHSVANVFHRIAVEKRQMNDMLPVLHRLQQLAFGLFLELWQAIVLQQ